MGPLHSLGSWGMNALGHAHPGNAAGTTAQAAEAGALAGVAKQAKGPVGHLAEPLAAAARGESVAAQAEKMSGAVKMPAVTALAVAGELAPTNGATARTAIQQANVDPKSGYQSPFVSIGLSGIRNNQSEAEGIARNVAGDQTPHGYAAYGSNGNSYQSDLNGQQPGINSPGTKSPTGPLADGLDAVNDVAAVTQYAAAAQLGITLTPKAGGTGKQVQIDWAALSKMEVSADLGALGGKIKYDNPAQVANNGYQAVMAEIAQRGGKPEDKAQMISLTGHSGGGQSSFYTALKLASDGYKNISLVGVDMAMTPHEREVLETLGVKVTNITSNNKDAKGNQSTSEVGDVIRTGMGGGQNFYDLNVQRQNQVGAVERHDINNDANVITTVRYAQYLDSIGQHGKYSPQMYEQFLKDTGGKGNQAAGSTADADLLSKVTDQRQLPGPDANSTKIGGGASTIETVVNLLGGKPVSQAISGVGQTIHNGFDKAGDFAKSMFGLIPKAGGFLGGLFHQGMDLLGGGINAAGNLLGSGLDKVGGLAQSVMSGIGGATEFLGGAVNSGLHALGGGISSVGNGIGNGLGAAGDTAKSWLGHIPLIGGFLGNAADKGLHALGGGVSSVGNLLGNGVGLVGDGAQAVTSTVAQGADALGGLANQGLGALGNGARWLGGMLGSGFDKVGELGQAGITGASNLAGNFLGNAASQGLGAVGSGIGSVFDKVGDWAGAKVRKLTGSTVRGLQGVGFDTSQIQGLSDFQSTNPSVTRGWNGLLTADKSDASKVQTIDVPGAGPTPLPPTYAQDFKQGIDGRLAATPELKPEQRNLVSDHLKGISDSSIAPTEIAAVDRALQGPNGDRAMAAYSDLIKLTEADPKAKERLSPEILGMLVSGVGDRRTDSDRGQSGIMGARQSRDAAQALLNLPPEDYQKVVGLLAQAGKDKDGKPIAGADPGAEQALLLKAVAARRDNVKADTVIDNAKKMFGIESKHDLAMKDLNQFAGDIRGTQRDELIRNTTLMDIDDVNTSKVDPNNLTTRNDTKTDNDGLYQRYNDSCAPTTQQILRGEMDPAYALKRHKQGLDNPDSDTEVAKEQATTLANHGGDSTLRQGDHARTALGGQISKAGLSGDQAQRINDLAMGTKLDPAKQVEAQVALQQLRDKNDGHPTAGELTSMQANAKNSASTRTGVWQGDAAKDLTNDVTHLELKEQTVTGAGIGPHLGNVEALLKDGQPVPFNVAWTGGGAHAMMMTDSRTDASGSKTYLVTDPWSGATRWVGQTELTDGTWYQKEFGGKTSTVQDLVADKNQVL